MRVVAEYADHWNIPSASPAVFEAKLDVLEEHCSEGGRDPKDVGIVGHHWMVINKETDRSHERYRELMAEAKAGPTPRGEDRGLVGTPAEVVNALEIYRELGVELFVVKPPEGDDRTLDPFVDEGPPAFE